MGTMGPNSPASSVGASAGPPTPSGPAGGRVRALSNCASIDVNIPIATSSPVNAVSIQLYHSIWRRRWMYVSAVLVAVALCGSGLLLLFRDHCLGSGGRCVGDIFLPAVCPVSGVPLATYTWQTRGAVWTWRGFQLEDDVANRKLVPRAYVIGAQKCGTTTLWDMMATHPSVRVGMRDQELSKELHYFDRSEELYQALGLDWYLSHWDHLKNQDGSRVTLLDATPDYLAEGHKVPSRMVEAFPTDAHTFRFVVMVCNPMERAYSLWHHDTNEDWNQWSREYPSFGNFVVEYLAKMKSCVAAMPATAKGDPMQQFSTCAQTSLPDVLLRGLYWQQLLVWFKYFDPQQFLIVEKSHLFGRDGAEWQRRIREHIGLDASVPFQQPPPYASGHSKLAQDDPTSYGALNEFYQPFTDLMLREAAACGFDVSSAREWHQPAGAGAASRAGPASSGAAAAAGSAGNPSSAVRPAASTAASVQT